MLDRGQLIADLSKAKLFKIFLNLHARTRVAPLAAKSLATSAPKPTFPPVKIIT